MSTIDLIVLVVYLLGLLIMGSVFSRMKTTNDMFNAGGKSPWWLSGLSSFMTTFSAGTFVVWGGIAYQYGLVAVSILVVLGISAIAVGFFFAGRWKSFGYESAAAFLHDRFGQSLVQFYTVLQGLVGIFTLGGAVYALSVIVTALIPLPPGHILADPETGNMSVTLASLFICLLVILITTGGGLWAVLVTDALQFIILFVGVLIVIPLIILKAGGMESFISQAPEGFFLPTAGDFTWLFLAGWTIVYLFKMGAEWGYVQRFTCVPTSKDARKSAYLFGVLYIVSPIIWMLPPMVYRIIDPNVNYEEAYILASQAVLPVGMLGLMVAAMCSATASTVTTQLNVYAGAFTSQFYHRLLRPLADQKELVVAGRIITVLLGGIAIAGALLIPRLGTYTGYVLASVAILTGPMVLPTIWGLYSRKIGLKTAWVVTLVSAGVGIFVKMGFQAGGWFENILFLEPLITLLQLNERVTEIAIGLLVPLALLLIAELAITKESEGWKKVLLQRSKYTEETEVTPSSLPAKICGVAMIVVGVIIGILAFFSEENFILMISFTLLLMASGFIFMFLAGRQNEKLIDNIV